MKSVLLLATTVLLMTGTRVVAADFETAAEAVRNMGVGWNLGNTLDANSQSVSGNPSEDAYWGQQGLESQTCWGQAETKPELLKMMREAGFGAIRVPVTWYNHMDRNGKVNAEWMKRVHEVIDYVIDQGLYCILNVHHDTGADDAGKWTSWLKADEASYAANKARYEYLWQQIAEEFKDYDQKLLFESYNEMLDSQSSWCFASFNTPQRYDAAVAASAYSAINKYAQSFVNVVRATGGNNARRNLIVNTYGACCGSGSWNAHLQDPLKEMKIPVDEIAGSGHIAVQVHSYPNVQNLTSTKAEVDGMFSALKTYLVDKGVPVIVGEWGTANSGETDYDVRRENVLQFADYFVKKAKAYNCATFYWMGLSEGTNRSLPVFNQKDLAQAIVQAWHGSTEGFQYPTRDDLGTTIYEVTFNSLWSELNLCNGAIKTSTYKAIELELADQPAAGAFQIKIYGTGSSKESHSKVTSAKSTVAFTTAMGTTISRITLQSFQEGNTATVKSVCLIKADGTRQKTEVSAFWGCSVTEIIVTGIRPITFPRPISHDAYNLNGQKVSESYSGIVIKDGKTMIQ